MRSQVAPVRRRSSPEVGSGNSMLKVLSRPTITDSADLEYIVLFLEPNRRSVLDLHKMILFRISN